MPDINRIVIKGSSGYCCVDEAFNDKVTITEDSISYEYIPYMESEITLRGNGVIKQAARSLR